MAYYVNGTLISGANTLPKMTMAEYLALPVSERPTYWECTDKDYDDISAENVSYGSGTVKDALDGLNKSFTKLQSSGQFVNIPAEAKEFVCYVKNSLSSDPQYVGYFNVEVLDMAHLNTVWFSDIYYYRYNKPSFSITSRRSGSNYDAEYMIIYWR